MTRVIFGAAVLNGLAVLVLGAWRLQRPEGFWTGRDGWILAALAVTGSTPILQAVLAERGERARRRQIEREQKFEAFLVSALIDLVNQAGTDWQQTGVQMFLVRGWWRRQRQQRVATVRLGPRPSSGVHWSKGKGVIGRVWDTRQHHVRDLAAHFAPFSHYGESSFMALSAEIRYGLSFDDFRRLNGKYGVVAAVPIVDRKDRYVGCLTADLPPHLSGSTLDTGAMVNALHVAARLVREVL